MCIAALGGILPVLSAVASIGGTLVSGMAQVNAARAAEIQDRNNAIIAQRNAADARKRGIVAENDIQMRNSQMRAKQINILSERSIDLAGGTALDIIGDTAMFGKMDALTTRGNFEREAIAYEGQKMNFNASAEQNKMKASAAMFGTGMSLFDTALGAVGNFAKPSAQMRLS